MTNTQGIQEAQEEISAVYKFVNGELVEISPIEYEEEMQKSQTVQEQKIVNIEQDDSRIVGRITSVEYKEQWGNNYYEKPPKKVSGTLNGGKAGGSIKSTQSVTREVGMNIGIEIPLSSVGVSLTVGFNVAQTRTSKVGYTLHVPKNKKAYMVFYPKMRYSHGTTEICREMRLGNGEFEVVCQTKTDSEMWFPVHLDDSDLLDGLVELRYVK